MKKKETFNAFGPALEDILLHLARKADHALRSPNSEAIEEISNSPAISLQNEPELIETGFIDGDSDIQNYLDQNPDFNKIIASIEACKIQAEKKEEDLLDLLVPTPEEINNTISKFEKSLTPIPLVAEEPTLEEESDSIDYDTRHIAPGGKVIEVSPDDVLPRQARNWHQPVLRALNTPWLVQLAACVMMLFMFSLGIMGSLKVNSNRLDVVNGMPQRNLSEVSIFPELDRLEKLQLRSPELTSLPDLDNLTKLKELRIESSTPISVYRDEAQSRLQISEFQLEDMGLPDLHTKNSDSIMFEITEKFFPYALGSDTMGNYPSFQISLAPIFPNVLHLYTHGVVNDHSSQFIAFEKAENDGQSQSSKSFTSESSMEFPKLSNERFGIMLKQIEDDIIEEEKAGWDFLQPNFYLRNNYIVSDYENHFPKGLFILPDTLDVGNLKLAEIAIVRLTLC